jgi:hypothetical protein
MTTKPDRQGSVSAVFPVNGVDVIGETSRPLHVCNKEQKYNLRQGVFDKPKSAQHAYEGHKICLNEAGVQQIEPNIIFRNTRNQPTCVR